MIACDFHIHLGRSRDGASLTAGELLRAMRQSDVRRAVIFPIDEPDVGRTYEAQNEKIFAEAKAHPEFIPFCRLSPNNRKEALRELENCRAKGFSGLKLHPRAEAICPNSVDDIFERVNDWGWPVVIHLSHEENCLPASWEPSFQKFSRSTFIFAHGGKDKYEEAIQVAARSPNTFLDTSTLSYNRTKIIIQKLGAGRVLFASDQPYSHIAVERKKFEVICSPQELNAIFEENPRRVFPNLLG